MHIQSRFDGGKQINRIQGGSWQARCAGAGLRCNEGAVKQTDKARKRKATDKAKSQCKRSRYSGNDNTLNSRRAYSRYTV